MTAKQSAKAANGLSRACSSAGSILGESFCHERGAKGGPRCRLQSKLDLVTKYGTKGMAEPDVKNTKLTRRDLDK